MYLTDEEIGVLLGKCLESLRPGGHLFFHETCFQSKGSLFVASNY